jgi:Tol biopolymer transport system component
LGREARFSASGFQIVYTHTDLNGNQDIWRHDLRNGNSERVTDADEIDFAADTSPDGRSIAFASARGGPVSVWTIPASGGKRLRLNSGGYFPRYSPDGRFIAFWNDGAVWVMSSDGGAPRQALEDAAQPAAPVWTGGGAPGGQAVRTAESILPSAGLFWPQADRLPDGRYIAAPIKVGQTALWAVDLMYK